MSRITTIRDQVADSSQKLEDALLQCLILADELGYEPLREWVDRELTGYQNPDELPDYRKSKSHLVGTLIEGANYVTNFGVPDHLLDSDLLDLVTTVSVFDGIGKLVHLPDDGSLSQGLIGRSLLESAINSALRKEHGPFVGMRSVTLPIPPGTFGGILSAVRQRLLTFLIDLNRLFPGTDDISQEASEMQPEVDRVFQSAVYNIHNPQRVVIAHDYNNSDYSINVTNNVQVGDFDSLREYLKEFDISDAAIDRFRPIAERLQKGDVSEEVEQSLVEWVGEQTKDLPKQTLEAAGSATKRAATELIVQGIKSFVPRLGGWINDIDFPDFPDVPVM